MTSPAAGACPSASVDDVWLDKRLGCFSVGQTIISIAGGSSDRVADTSFVVAQRVLTSGFDNVLGADKLRHFSRIVCVRNAPSDMAPLSLATDLVVATRASGQLPNGYQTYLSVEGGNQAGWVKEPCDPAKHPIIIDFATKKIESLTPAALSAVSVYDL